MYNLKSKIRLLLLSSIATMFVEIEGENNRKQKENPREWFKLIFFQYYCFCAYIKKKSTRSLFGPWSFLLIHIQFTPSEGPKAF